MDNKFVFDNDKAALLFTEYTEIKTLLTMVAKALYPDKEEFSIKFKTEMDIITKDLQEDLFG